MDWILFLKIIHVVAAIVAMGSNLTCSFWIRYAALERVRLT